MLVQVYAVAIDKFDADMVREKAAAGSGGGKWIPGRSFFGRALDVGGEVRTIIKGDLVIGLVDIKKVSSIVTVFVSTLADQSHIDSLHRAVPWQNTSPVTVVVSPEYPLDALSVKKKSPVYLSSA